jgi:hypothetical protein
VNLTFVVPTIPGRESLLSRCLYSITSQPGDYRVLVMAGEGQLGDKANAAAQLVETSHMTIVDDDDYLDGSYVALVNEALGTDPDYVGLNVLCMLNGSYWQTNSTHGDHGRWDEHDRGPVPKGITRTSIWRDTPMGNEFFGDRYWMADVAAKVKTSVYIDRDIYIYDYWPKGSAYAGTNAVRQVGAWPVDRSRIEVIDA